MLPTRFRKQPADVVFDERHISNIHIAGHGGANSPVAVRRFVGKKPCRWLKFERFRKDRLVACVRRLDVGDDLRRVGEIIGELRLDGQFHSQTPGTVVTPFCPARLAPSAPSADGVAEPRRGEPNGTGCIGRHGRYDQPDVSPSSSIKAQGNAHER
jgi:hypothetical protein